VNDAHFPSLSNRKRKAWRVQPVSATLHDSVLFSEVFAWPRWVAQV